jgi:tetratricopeptide (TPR) repeat protein
VRKWSQPAQRNRNGQACPPALTLDGSAGAYEDARRLYELAADFGDADALGSLAAMLKEAGNFAEAERFYQQAINGASRSALRGLASLWEETGDQESARRCLQYGLDAEGNAASPWTLDDTDDQS